MSEAEREIEFLSVQDVLEIHDVQLSVYGGSHGIRDIGLVESAVAMPQASFGGEFLHKDRFRHGGPIHHSILRSMREASGPLRAGSMDSAGQPY